MNRAPTTNELAQAMGGKISELHAECERLRVELAEARKDTKRLDYEEKNGSVCHWRWDGSGWAGSNGRYYATRRAAIDDAMGAKL